MHYFSIGIDSGHGADAFHVTGGGLFQCVVAVVGIAAVFGFGSFLVEFSDNFGEGHFVGFAYAHVDDFGAGICGEGGALGAFDFFELIDGGGLAVLLPADAVGEEILNVRVRHKIGYAPRAAWFWGLRLKRERREDRQVGADAQSESTW